MTTMRLRQPNRSGRSPLLRAPRRRAGAATGLMLLLLATGCGKSQHNRYVPAPSDARAALVAALDGWKSGQPPGRIERPDSAVQAVDSQWRDGAKLQDYEIVGEQPGDGPMEFSVRLSLGGSPEKKEVRYMVIGRDPIWVVRDQDYTQFQNM